MYDAHVAPKTPGLVVMFNLKCTDLYAILPMFIPFAFGLLEGTQVGLGNEVPLYFFSRIAK